MTTDLALGQQPVDVTTPCAVDDCIRQAIARGWCEMHWSRWKRHGDPLVMTRATNGTGHVNAKTGYVWIGKKGHPLAVGDRQNVTVHRALLWDSIGPGPHGCYWCGVLIDWEPSEYVERLCVDHLDGVKQNNARENLVPACQSCNVYRSRRPLSRPSGEM